MYGNMILQIAIHGTIHGTIHGILKLFESNMGLTSGNNFQISGGELSLILEQEGMASYINFIICILLYFITHILLSLYLYFLSNNFILIID